MVRDNLFRVLLYSSLFRFRRVGCFFLVLLLQFSERGILFHLPEGFGQVLYLDIHQHFSQLGIGVLGIAGIMVGEAGVPPEGSEKVGQIVQAGLVISAF